jgi:hypothetical protein
MNADVMAKIVKDAEGKYFLTDAQIDMIVNQIIKTVKIPFLSGDLFKTIIAKIIKKIDSILYTVLPNEIYNFINSAADGVSKEELETIKRRLVEIINKLIDIPFVSEDIEALIIGTILDLIISCFEKGKVLA